MALRVAAARGLRVTRDAAAMFRAPSPIIMRAVFLCRRFMMLRRSSMRKTAILLLEPVSPRDTQPPQFSIFNGIRLTRIRPSYSRGWVRRRGVNKDDLIFCNTSRRATTPSPCGIWGEGGEEHSSHVWGSKTDHDGGNVSLQEVHNCQDILHEEGSNASPRTCITTRYSASGFKH